MSGRARPASATLTPIMEDSLVSQESIMSGRASPLFPEGPASKAAGADSYLLHALVSGVACMLSCQGALAFSRFCRS